MAETDPAKIPCTEGGQRHVIPKASHGGTHRIACSECRMVFVRDVRWAQGWRPAESQGTYQRLYEAEKVVREQRDGPLPSHGSSSVVPTYPLMKELERLQRAVMGEPTDTEG